MFSDEKPFSLNKTSNRMWIEDGTTPPSRPLTKYKYTVMVWGAVWYQGRTPLCIGTGNINSKRYCEILGEYLLPSYPYGPFKLLQDNAPGHISKNTVKWCQEMGVTIFPAYPPYSPECNPIELLWAEMQHKVNGMSPNSPEALREAIEHAWDEIPQSHIQAIIDRLPSVLQKIIAARGEHV